MQTNTFAKALRGFTPGVPFRPFTVELINGRQLLIEHPEALVVRRGLAVHIAPGGALTISDDEGVNQFTGAPDNQVA